jgi:hypothetical protein
MDQRTELRISAAENATVTILGHPDVTLPCHVQDVSKSGLCILVRQPIADGRAVKVEWGEHFLLGRVRRASAAGTEFKVGLELLYCSKWTEPMRTVLAAL